MVNSNELEVLLVEDNSSDAELAMRALSKRNLANRLLHVKDGAEALDYIFCKGPYAGRKMEEHPKVIMLDLKLPRVDGLEVLRVIKSDERTRPIPVVVLTSSKEDKDVVESYKLGVNSYIVKPVDFDKFSEAVSGMGYYWLFLNHSS